MMKVTLYNAECGDAFRLEYPDETGKQHNLLIDGGYGRTFRKILRNEIDKVATINLWIVTHIHDDHIGGIEAYLSDLPFSGSDSRVENWLYNMPRQGDPSGRLPNPSSPSSILQGDALTRYLQLKGMMPREAISGDIIQLYSLNIRILSPNTESLGALRAKYARPDIIREREESDDVSSAMTSQMDDYGTKVEDFELDFFCEDDNIENGSSIATVMTFKKETLLWLSDAHPSVVISELRRLGYSEDKPLICCLAQVAHHGSKSNNSRELYSLLQCNNFVVSANGSNKHLLPSKITLARILRQSGRDISRSSIKFYFTADNPTLRRIFEIDGVDVFQKWNFTIEYCSADALTIDFFQPRE